MQSHSAFWHILKSRRMPAGREKGDLKMENKLPWYRTILFKLSCLIIAIIIPSVVLYINLYTTFQRELTTRLVNTSYREKSQIMEQFDEQISNIESYVWQFYQTGKTSYLSDLWDYYSELERAQKIADIQEQLSVYKSLESFIYDISIYMPQREICIRSDTWKEMDSEDWNALEEYRDNPENFLIDEGGVRFYLGELNQGSTIRSICQVTIPSDHFRKLINSFCTDSSISAAVLLDGTLYMQNVGDEDKLRFFMDEIREEKEEDSDYSTREITYANEEYYCTKVEAAGSRVQAFIFQNYEEVFSETQESFMMLPMIFGINILMFVIAVLYVRKYVRRPVQILKGAFENLGNGTEYVQIEEKTGDEFDILYSGFNEMSRNLSEYVRENYLAKIALQREQLKQLQAQINPHFLYNTLLFIKIRIRRKDLEGAEEMTALLSDYYRFINRNKRDIIPLKEELGCVAAYMKIQTQRFANRLRFEMEECPEELEDSRIPRLILQPLVENAVKYGLEQTENLNVIRISFRIFLTRAQVIVEQSGIEIPEETIKEMNAYINGAKAGGEVTSTININQRLQLFYGNDYRLHYCRTKVGGLQAVVDLAYEK